VFPLPNTTPYYVPPIQQPTLPGMPQGGFNSPPAFVTGGFNPGRGGRSNGGRGCRCGCCGRGCTPFSNHVATQGSRFQGTGRGSFQDIGGAQYPAQQMTPPHLNVTKKYSNWNICYLCGFDLEDGHTLSTCPWDWQKLSQGFTQPNAQSYIAGGYDCCTTKGMHKNVFPLPAAFWHGGAEITYTWANKFNNLFLCMISFWTPLKSPSLARAMI
jgi:hypothetical protein